MLQVLSFAAHNERDNIRKRQAEGIAVARLRGVHLGRPVKECPAEFLQIVDQWEKKKIPMQEALRQSGMSESTFYRRRRELRLMQESMESKCLEQNPFS